MSAGGIQPGGPPPRRRVEWPFATVLGGVLAGLLLVGLEGVLAGSPAEAATGGGFRLGTAVAGAALLLGALLRALLPERVAGLLRVRGRVIDVAVLGVLGGGLAVLAIVTPTTG